MRRNKRQKPPPPPVETLVSNLPCEITQDILIRLPSKSLLRFKCVSKSWNALISYPQFIQSHHNHSQTSTYQTKTLYRDKFKTSFVSVYSRGDEETQIEKLHFPGHHRNLIVLCSCDGLVLLLREKYAARVYVQIFYVWNPSVRKYAKFLYPSYFPSYYGNTGRGLCYDSSTCDYKVVVIDESHYFVYSVGKDSWGKSKVFPYKVTRLTASVFVNGALHWVVNSGNDGVGDDGPRTGDIICFNPTDENFSMFHRPYEFVEKNCEFCLTALGGRLSFYCLFYEKRMMEIWLRRTGNVYNHTSSWEKMTIISDIPISTGGAWCAVRLICDLRESKILLHIQDRLVQYDVRERKFVEVSAERVAPFSGYAYVDSMLLPGVKDKPKRKWLKTEKKRR